MTRIAAGGPVDARLVVRGARLTQTLAARRCAISVPVNLSSVVRASGLAIATLIPATSKVTIIVRAKVLGLTDFAARKISPQGITLLSITADEGESFSRAQTIGSRVLPTTVWVGTNILVLTAADRLPVPRLARAAIVGSAVYGLDVASIRWSRRLLAAAEPADGAATS